MSLPADVARCPGYSAEGQWREGCDDCKRRTSPPVNHDRVLMMAPPSIVVFECEARIPPDWPPLNPALKGMEVMP
jgi:hypothetical protein